MGIVSELLFQKGKAPPFGRAFEHFFGMERGLTLHRHKSHKILDDLAANDKARH